MTAALSPAPGNLNADSASDSSARTPNQIREGSTLYYALLHTSPAQKQAISALLTLCKTLAETLHDVSEPEVAEKKIHWWHEEITRLYGGEPRHPATKAVARTINEAGIGQALFLSVLEANNSEKFSNADGNEAYSLRLQKDYGARLSVCQHVLTTPHPDDDAATWLPHLTQGLGTFDRLVQFRRLHHRGYPVFPDSDYSRANLQPEQLYSADHPAAAAALLEFRIQDANEQLQLALSNRELIRGQGLLPFHTVAVLRQAQLADWQRKQFQPDSSYLTLTPLRKAWMAWRCKSKHTPTL